MITYEHSLAGTNVNIYFPETRADLRGFEDFLAKGDSVLGLDSETTGLGIYEPGFQVRLIQFGNRDEAWVLRVDLFRDVIIWALRQQRLFTVHNAAYDLQVIDRHLGVTIEELGPRTHDTRVMAHLLDSREEAQGGIGLGLKALSAVYVDDTAPDTSGDLTKVFNKMGLTKATGWAEIPIDHPTYVRYAGLDPVLARRLYDRIFQDVQEIDRQEDLYKFELHLQVLTCLMQRRGILVDVPYTERLQADLDVEAVDFAKVARRYGVENPNSTRQVSASLLAMGENLTQTTGAGALQVSKEVLLPLADLNKDWERLNVRKPNPLADAILRGNRAKKWSEAYAGAFLTIRDSSNRIHPTINSLGARTARMSVSRPPVQQLPSGDWRVRRALIADPGKVIVACDYAAVEMRVLAALCRDEAMMGAILAGQDLHDFTASKIYGPGFTKAQRKVAKAVGLGKVYGGGAAHLSRQTGVPLDQVKQAVDAYDATFPGVKAYGNRLMRRAEWGKKECVTPAGRHIQLDKDRLYAATNAVTQSTARDLLAQAIVRLHDAGLGEVLLMPVHDEIVAQADEREAQDVVRAIADAMDCDFAGIPIAAEASVYGKSWGHGYGAPS